MNVQGLMSDVIKICRWRMYFTLAVLVFVKATINKEKHRIDNECTKMW